MSGLDLVTSPVIGVTISKVRHKYVVVVEGTVTTNVTNTVTAKAKVNGVPMEGGTLSQKCTGPCTVGGTWFLDIDAAEAANPGTFFAGGSPLPLQATLEGFAGSSTTGNLVLVARMEKK